MTPSLCSGFYLCVELEGRSPSLPTLLRPGWDWDMGMSKKHTTAEPSAGQLVLLPPLPCISDEALIGVWFVGSKNDKAIQQERVEPCCQEGCPSRLYPVIGGTAL